MKVCNKPEVIRISGKNLGALAIDGACERCAWLRIRMSHRMPFQVFPGIFSSIDSFSKNLVHGYLDQHGRPPAWLRPLGDIVDYLAPPHWSKFNMVDEEFGVLLTGAPDGVFVLRKGGYIIGDYKTARYTKAQDALFPMYEVQLNIYAMIAEHIGLTPVKGLALVYTEPQTDAAGITADDRDRRGIWLPFNAVVVPVERRPQIIIPLLQRVRALVDRPSPPPALDGCRDCRQVDAMIDLIRGPKRRTKEK